MSFLVVYHQSATMITIKVIQHFQAMPTMFAPNETFIIFISYIASRRWKFARWNSRRKHRNLLQELKWNYIIRNGPSLWKYWNIFFLLVPRHNDNYQIPIENSLVISDWRGKKHPLECLHAVELKACGECAHCYPTDNCQISVDGVELDLIGGEKAGYRTSDETLSWMNEEKW